MILRMEISSLFYFSETDITDSPLSFHIEYLNTILRNTSYLLHPTEQ